MNSNKRHACLHYHLASNELPACAFSDDVEKGWDRSFSSFVEAQKKK